MSGASEDSLLSSISECSRNELIESNHNHANTFKILIEFILLLLLPFNIHTTLTFPLLPSILHKLHLRRPVNIRMRKRSIEVDDGIDSCYVVLRVSEAPEQVIDLREEIPDYIGSG